ncbi:MAG: alpha-E domain-containing protein [Gammaproteobacteria bacterium]|nr:alpha-E domain-containing protein [Gammaproteobacteria bacterium]
MLSRVAENVYWMSRYVERAENIARIINVNAFLLLDLPKKVRPGWEPLVQITGGEALFKDMKGIYDERHVVKFLIGEELNPGSLLSSLRQARENARTIRDFVPRETYEYLNELYLFARTHLSKGLSAQGRFGYLKSIILGTQTITGLLAGSMIHDDGYDFLRMGRNLERGDMTTRIIDVRSANLLPNVASELRPFESIQWVSVLKSLSAYQMYRRKMQVNVRRAEALRFLLQERSFPRAFAHTVGEVEFCLRSLPHNTQPLKIARGLLATVNSVKPEKLQQAELHQFIDSLQLTLNELHDCIYSTYFSAQASEPKPQAEAVRPSQRVALPQQG